MTGSQEKGFTLIEFLVAIVILMVGLLGMLQAINIALDKNLDNVFRTEAVSLADDRMMMRRALKFTDLTGSAKSYQLTRSIRGISKNFMAQEVINPLTLQSKEIDITVTWTKKNNPYPYTHSISSVVSTIPQ